MALEDNTTEPVGAETVRKEFQCKTPDVSGSLPVLEAVSSEADHTISGSAASREDAEIASKEVSCNSASEDSMTMSDNAQPSSKDVRLAPSTKYTLETLPVEILIEIFEHLGAFDGLGLALASMKFSTAFQHAYPKIAHHFKERKVIMGLSGPPLPLGMKGTYVINGISSDGKSLFVTPVESANTTEREREKKEKPKNRLLRWLRRLHL